MSHSSCRLLTLVPCLLAAVSWPVGAEMIKLGYGPTDGAQFVVTERLKRVTEFTDRQPVTDIRERKYGVVVKHTDTGFANTATVQSLTLTRNASEVASPVFSSMAGLDLTYTLDADGKLLRISGYEDLPEAMRGRLPAGLATSMIQLLNHESLRRQDELAYRQVYGDLPGSTLEAGVSHPSAAGHALPYGGWLPLYSVETLHPATDAKPLRLVRRYNSDAATLAEECVGIETADLIAQADSLRPLLPENHEGASVRGTETTLFDSSGLLIQDQTVSLTYLLSLKQPEGDPVTFTIYETREFAVSPAEPAEPAE